MLLYHCSCVFILSTYGFCGKCTQTLVKATYRPSVNHPLWYIKWFVDLFLWVCYNATCMLSSRSLRSNKGIGLSVPRVKTNRFSHLCSVSLKQPPTVCPFSHFSCYLQETAQDTSLWLGLPPPPIDTSTPNDPLMLWNCFFNFAVEHWFGYCTAESGFSRDVGAIEILKIFFLVFYRNQIYWLMLLC